MLVTLVSRGEWCVGAREAITNFASLNFGERFDSLTRRGNLTGLGVTHQECSKLYLLSFESG